MRGHTRFAAICLFALVALIATGCGDSGTTTTVAGTAAATTTPPATTVPPATSAPTTVAPTTVPPATTVPPTTAVATTTVTTQPAFQPAPSVTLDDGSLAMEPPDTSYRATLLFTMTRVLADGTVQMGMTNGDGGKIIDPASGAVAHSFVIDTNEFTDLPDCLDLPALTPTWVSVYHTFYGNDGGDLAGDALLSEIGIMSNGVLVDRYAITLDNIKPEESNNYESLTEAYVDIARDGGHVVRLVLSGVGKNNTFTIDQSEGRDIVYELNFSEFGTITEFTIPPDCLPG